MAGEDKPNRILPAHQAPAYHAQVWMQWLAAPIRDGGWVGGPSQNVLPGLPDPNTVSFYGQRSLPSPSPTLRQEGGHPSCWTGLLKGQVRCPERDSILCFAALEVLHKAWWSSKRVAEIVYSVTQPHTHANCTPFMTSTLPGVQLFLEKGRAFFFSLRRNPSQAWEESEESVG